MKRTLIALLMLGCVLSIAVPAFAWQPSFRSSASGQLLWGDFDNDLDPIYIHNNTGYRFYSILSNLTSGSNAFMENDSPNDDRFLMGASGQFGIPSRSPWVSRSSFVIQLADETYDASSGLDTDLDGEEEISGYGELKETVVREQDWDPALDRYTTRITNNSSASSYQILKARDWQLTHSYKNGDRVLGLSIAHHGYGDNYTENNHRYGYFSWVSPDFDFSYNNTELTTDYSGTDPVIRYRGLRFGEFSSIGKSPSTSVRLAYQMPFPPITNSEIRFDLTYDKFTNEFVANDKVGTSDIYNLIGYVDTTIRSESFVYESDGNGSHITPSVQLTKHWAPETYSWFSVSLGFGSNNNDYTTRRNYHSFDYTDNEYYQSDIENRSETYSYTGDDDFSSLTFYHKTVHEFSKNFIFAAGFAFSKSKYETKDIPYTYNYRRVNEQFTDDGVDGNDWVRTRTVLSSGTYTDLSKSTSLTLPVAMEYVLGKWTFRLGGQHIISKYESEYAFAQKGVDVATDTTVYGDGSGSGPYYPQNEDYSSYSENHVSKSHYNTFWYGLQFMPNKNLRIELMDFMSTGDDFIDSEFFSNLRMSFTLLF